MFIALDLEKKYSKHQILEFYLNNVNFGNGYYGVEAAAQSSMYAGVVGQCQTVQPSLWISTGRRQD